MNPYEQLLEEVRKNKMDYQKLKTLLEEIKSEIKQGKLPTFEGFMAFTKALEIIEARSFILKDRLDKIKLKSKVNKTYKP
ncbi:MAG: hypothetical protein ABGX27_09140 [Desulfurobacteriaceae bacterium]